MLISGAGGYDLQLVIRRSAPDSWRNIQDRRPRAGQTNQAVSPRFMPLKMGYLHEGLPQREG